MSYLVAVYDLAVGPTSFDFVVFAVQAEMERRAKRLGALHFVFVPDENGPGGFRDKRPFYDQHEALWRFRNICVPACGLLNASYSVVPDIEFADTLDERGFAMWPEDWDAQSLKRRHHLVGGVIRRAKEGFDVPMLSASEHARRKVREHFASFHKPVVTLTVRTTYLPERNMDPREALAVVDHIHAMGYVVKSFLDTDVALSKGTGYGELNLDLRMACYQEAAMNLQANNGAASLCWFSEAPYLMFDAGVPVDEWRGLFVEQGLPLGETWPWARKNQRLVYGKANAMKIIQEFEAAVSTAKEA